MYSVSEIREVVGKVSSRSAGTKWTVECRLLAAAATSLYDALIHPFVRLRQPGDAMKTIAGLLLATLLAVSAGCARTDWIDRTLVTVDVTGVWTGGPGRSGASTSVLQLELEQQGSTVKGFIRLREMNAGGGFSGPIDGTIAGDVFRFSGARAQWEGELTVSGDEMVGLMSGVGSVYSGVSRPFSFRRIDPSPRPASPPR